MERLSIEIEPLFQSVGVRFLVGFQSRHTSGSCFQINVWPGKAAPDLFDLTKP